jgi:UDP-N-acetylmuramoyl-tripeptide--D-alanyl-D-alanine ligase
MITAKELASALRPALLQSPSVGPIRFRKAVVDSRKARRGDLFFALKGDREDGHNFVADAARHGAVGAVVERLTEAEIAEYVVPSPLEALQNLARQRRAARPRLKVVAITGSVGKTTTKELTAAILGTRYPLLKNEGNLNSEIGLPMVLLELSTRHRRAVLEMGMWATGEIRLLCDIAHPDIGIVTNVGPSHMERLGSIEAITNAKAELVESLPPEGVAILNADDPRVMSMVPRTPAHVVTYGLAEDADVRAEDIESRGLAGLRFTLTHGDKRAPAYTRLAGKAMVHNALAAATAAIVDGMELDEIAAALTEAQIPTRLATYPGPNGSTIIDDSYNASPASMRAALDLLGEVAGRKIAVLGDMRELGAAEADGHREVGAYAANVADEIYAVGELGRSIAEAATDAGHSAVHIVESKDRVAAMLRATLDHGDVVLLKASRALALESVLEELREDV